jgi:capsular exopolysaccharide synthesis family protein
MELSKLWEIIQRRKWIILQALFVVTLVTVMGSRLVRPTFEATCRILFVKAIKDLGFEEGGVAFSSLSAFMTTTNDLGVNKVLGTSRPYLKQLVLKLQLRDEDGQLTRPDKLSVPGPIYGFKEALFPQRQIAIRQSEDTNILTVRSVSSNPEETMMMANTLGDIMVRENQKSVRAEYRNARLFLEGQVSEVKELYNKALVKMVDFRKEEQTLNLEIETQFAAEKMAGLLKEKEDIIIGLAETRAGLGRLQEQLAKENPGFLSASTLQENPHIDILKKKLTELRLQLALAKSDLTEEHPQVLSLGEQIKVAEAELKKEVEIYRSSAPELASLQRRIASQEARLKGVNGDLDRYFKTVEEFPDKIRTQAGLDMELNLAQQRYSSLLDSLQQIELAEASILSEIRVIEPAVTPSKPVSPNRAKHVLIGILAGLTFGLTIAFVYELHDDTIRTAEDAKELRHIGFMGLVPIFKSTKQPLISTKDPNDPLCESYRRIRNYPSIDDGSVRSLLVTSPGPNEGKSTTVVNLGISVAREGKKVVLVDMDLRRARLHAYFNLPNQVGVTDVLQEEASLDEAIQDTPVEGLNIISGGSSYPDAGSLMESSELGLLITDLQARYDMVILDSAPVLVKSDALVLAKHVDGSIIVIESERTTRRAALEVTGILAEANIKPLGFVLNRFSIKKGKHFYHQYFGHGGRELLVGDTG